MYGKDAEDEELRIAATAMVAVGTATWLIVNSDETKVEDDDNDEEAEATVEAQRDADLRATDMRVKAVA
jgi:hypothetical protein